MKVDNDDGGRVGEHMAGAERAGGMSCRWLGCRIISTKIKRERDGAMAVGGRC
jgi:hypothetical protein